MSKLRVHIIYTICATVFIVGFLEISARLIGLAPSLQKQYGNYIEDKYVPYRPRPLSRVSGTVCTREYDYDYRYNTMGFRDVEHAVEKPAGVFRILGLGDSFTEGAGVAFEESYLYQLEQMLNARGGTHPRVEIIKAGIGGYSARSERLLLQHYGMQYQPDLILVGFLPNDIMDAFTDQDYKAVTSDGYLLSNEARELGKAGQWLYLHSHFCRVFLMQYVNVLKKQHARISWDEVWEPNEKSLGAWKKIETEYGQMAQLARQADAKMVFIHIPQHPDPTVGDWAADGWTFPSRQLSRWCKENAQYFIDALPYLRAELPKGPLYYKIDGHCNARGYKVVAQALYSELVKQNLVP